MSHRDANWTLRTVADVFAPERELVHSWLREYNLAASPGFMEKVQRSEHQAMPLIILARKESVVVGGLFAETQLAWLRISIMAVHPEFRSQGVGSALLAEAERQAVTRRCEHAFVDTMSYQAPRFYTARGFQVAGEIPDWDSHGHSKLYLIKRLPSPLPA